ncbi:MAG TPA: (d)CMP kinase [Spirochaetia bacterium]|nr:(d)CMP kinase [Spirochaetia bacterium]
MKIAISGKSGCGNSTVTQRVADRLGYRRVNYTFKDMAAEEGVSFERLCEMAEHDSRWDLRLDRKQVEMAREGDAVLGSRLAIWVLDDADLRVYLDAPPEIRAQRIRKRHIETGQKPTGYEAVLTETVERDQRDHDRYLRLYGIDNDEFGFADLIIDTSDTDPEEVTDMIIAAAEKKRAARTGGSSDSTA